MTLLADVRQKLADAREERLEFLETFEHLVKVGLLGKRRILYPQGEQRHSSDQLAEHSDKPDIVGIERQQPSCELVVNRHGRTILHLALRGNR